MDEELLLKLVKEGKSEEARVLINELKGIKKIVMEAKLLSLHKNWDGVIKKLTPILSKESGDDVLRLLGYARFNRQEYKDSYKMFMRIREKNVDDYFMLAVLATMYEDVMGARQYLRASYEIDKERFKELMGFFYDIFVAPHPELTINDKVRLSAMLKGKRGKAGGSY